MSSASVIPKRTVLVAEDDVITQKLVRAALENRGYTVETVGNGQDCIDKVRAGASYCLLILDLQMPGLGGLEVLQRLQLSNEVEKFPILVFSGQNHQGTIRQAIELGADDYLLKPINVADFSTRAMDLVFELDEPSMREMLSHLHMQTPSLLSDPGLNKWFKTPRDPYSTLYKGKPIAILIEQGLSPIKLAKREKFEDIMRDLVILRKCAFGWRILWSQT